MYVCTHRPPPPPVDSHLSPNHPHPHPHPHPDPSRRRSDPTTASFSASISAAPRRVSFRRASDSRSRASCTLYPVPAFKKELRASRRGSDGKGGPHLNPPPTLNPCRRRSATDSKVGERSVREGRGGARRTDELGRRWSALSPSRRTPSDQESQAATYLEACPSRMRMQVPSRPKGDWLYHIYCSQNNVGAAGLIGELQAWLSEHRGGPHDAAVGRSSSRMTVLRLPRLPSLASSLGTSSGLPPSSEPPQLAWTQEREHMPRCSHFLLLLNETTWTSGGQSAELAKEILEAFRAGVHVLLAHETIDVTDAFSSEMMPLWRRNLRRGVPFESFFHCTAGCTPKVLVRSGLYDEIAVPLKGGVYRPVSMALLAKTALHEPEPDSQGRTFGRWGLPRSLSLTELLPTDAISMAWDTRASDSSRSTGRAITGNRSTYRLGSQASMGGLGGRRRRQTRRGSILEEFGVPQNQVPDGVRSLGEIGGAGCRLQAAGSELYSQTSSERLSSVIVSQLDRGASSVSRASTVFQLDRGASTDSQLDQSASSVSHRQLPPAPPMDAGMQMDPHMRI